MISSLLAHECPTTDPVSMRGPKEATQTKPKARANKKYKIVSALNLFDVGEYSIDRDTVRGLL